ncbi:MAG: peptidase [Oscillatoriales cyanobacterium CG2_30_40_61]|nr:MAG: peptidase [Oscillatoriales cyanobacterium CG2_30_40_61]
MNWNQHLRKWHRTLAPIVLLPLFVTVATGVFYRLGKSWLGLSSDQVHLLMSIHEGEYLGKTLEPVYVLLNGLGLLWMLVTGGIMVFQQIKPLKKLQSGIAQVKSLFEKPSLQPWDDEK